MFFTPYLKRDFDKVYIMFRRTHKRTVVRTIEHSEKAYSAKEISRTLNVGDSTLRKWCLALEKNGYNFIRNEQNNRVFVEHDLVALRHFQTLLQEHNFKIDNAANIVTARFKGGAFPSETDSVLEEVAASTAIEVVTSDNQIIRQLLAYIEEQDKTSKMLLERLEKQEAFNHQLLERLDKQDRFVEERLKERDTMLMETVRTLQALKEEKKKGLFQKLFRG